jgi:cytosine/uracil/thiamine/allantoin permease
MVDTLGMVAGAIWISAALHFRFVRDSKVHPGVIGGTFCIGVALMLSSSALVVERPSTVVTFAALANAIFCFVGVAMWIWLVRTTHRLETARSER